MKHYIISMFIQLTFNIYITVSLGSPVNLKLFSSSPIGPYRLDWKHVYICNNNNKIQHNLYLSHRKNNTIIFGNSTLTVPFDNNILIDIRMALKDSSGIWKENVYIHKSPKGCSMVKQLFGKAWPELIKSFGFPIVNCPLPAGNYTLSGVDLQSICEKSNIPNVFVYGTYKLHIYYIRNNEIVGCQGLIFNLIRP